MICEQHPFGGVTYLYENVTKEIQLESRYNEMIGVQRETLDNLHEGVALFGADGRLKLYNPAFARFWSLDPEFLDRQPHVDQVIEGCREMLADELVWDELKYSVTSLDADRKPLKSRLRRPDGLALDFASVPLPDGNTLLTYVDVTDEYIRDHPGAHTIDRILARGMLIFIYEYSCHENTLSDTHSSAHTLAA